MKAGILGSGIVGRVLASAFLKEGYDVMLGTRDITKDEVAMWKAANPEGQTGTFAETAAFADIIVLAAGGSVAGKVIEMAGIPNFSGKVVIDATNPIAPAAPENGVLKFFTTLNRSLMEDIQEQLPEAHVVKAFSCIGNAFMYKPDFGGIQPTMFICGNNDEAKKTVTGILTAFGFETADMGKAEAARAIEPLCILWCIPGITKGEWSHAFKLLKK
ncbi:MAG: NAD(P)-binding domain-containing protein [Ferruginibacter sp.]